MKFICIIGERNSEKDSVEKTLEQMGFKRNIEYTTNNNLETDYYKAITKEKFIELVKSDIILKYTENNGNLYGIARPYGAKLYVSIVDIDSYKVLKDIYGEQVIGVNLKYTETTPNINEETVDIVIDNKQDLNKMIADILKNIRTDRKEEYKNETMF